MIDLYPIANALKFCFREVYITVHEKLEKWGSVVKIRREIVTVSRQSDAPFFSKDINRYLRKRMYWKHVVEHKGRSWNNITDIFIKQTRVVHLAVFRSCGYLELAKTLILLINLSNRCGSVDVSSGCVHFPGRLTRQTNVWKIQKNEKTS